MNQHDLPYSRLQGHPPYHPTCYVCHLPDVVWIRCTSKRKKRYSSFMRRKEFSEFQVEPVSGGTPESGQVIWERVWKLQLERKCFYPTRDVHLGLGLIWGCFMYGHMVQVFACHKGRGLQEVRVSTLILTSAYGSEVWCIFWRKIMKHWILLENYSFLFFTFISCLCLCPFLLSEYTPSIHGSQRAGHDWLTEQQQSNTHTPFTIETEFWKLKLSFFTLNMFLFLVFFFFCYHLQRELIHPKQALA